MSSQNSEMSGDSYSFPPGFLFGTASSSYQVEGGWDEGGKGENIWDKVVHTNPKFIHDRTNGDIACDSYHLYKTDVEIIKHVGFDFYRFSISWSRILPTEDCNNINEIGIEYYNNLINELLKKGVQPMITMYHWDLPQYLEDIGGWMNPKIADHFEHFARILFKNFGDRVKWWITINEPSMVSVGYAGDLFAPGLKMHGTADYIVGHNTLRAHAKAYRLYEKEFKSTQNGKISISITSPYYIPLTNSKEDEEAANRAQEFEIGWFANPIFTDEGDYPKVMRDVIDKNSKLEKRASSRLPTFTKEEIEQLKGSCDFFAYQHYTSRNTTTGEEDHQPSWRRDSNVKLSSKSEWNISNLEWLKVVPEGLRGVLNWIKNRYNNPDVIITENGYGDQKESGLDDQKRVNYFSSYLREILKAIHEDKCKLIGYTVWSIMDNFEWRDGYLSQFGIYKVDFSDPERKREPKSSALYLKDVIAKRKLKK